MTLPRAALACDAARGRGVGLKRNVRILNPPGLSFSCTGGRGGPLAAEAPGGLRVGLSCGFRGFLKGHMSCGHDQCPACSSQCGTRPLPPSHPSGPWSPVSHSPVTGERVGAEDTRACPVACLPRPAPQLGSLSLPTCNGKVLPIGGATACGQRGCGLLSGLTHQPTCFAHGAALFPV